MKKALFLDRDGVINIEKNYVYKIEEFEFVDGIFNVCKYFQDRGYLLIVTTNQAGIARGYYNEDDFHKLCDWMVIEFKKRDIIIDKIYFCPHHPESPIKKYRVECYCRKPKPGMILEAQKDFNIDLKKSILVGDKESDVKAGLNAGITKNILIGSSGNNINKIKGLKIVSSIKRLIDFS